MNMTCFLRRADVPFALVVGLFVWERASAGDCVVVSSDPVPGSYIVTFNRHEELSPAAVPDLSNELAARYGLTPVHIYTHAVPGFSIHTSHDVAGMIAADPNVAYVKQDGWVHGISAQNDDPSHLDRIDQRNQPPNEATPEPDCPIYNPDLDTWSLCSYRGPHPCAG